MQKVKGWIGALFSAECKYVASEYSYHGPLPWSIYEVSTGRRLYQFSALDEEEKDDVYEPIEWNPTHDSLLLREYFPKHDGRRVLEVFDVGSGSTLETLPHASVVAWSADGTHVITADANRLIWHPTKLGSSLP